MRDWAERAVSTAHGLGDRPLAAAATAVHAFACAADGAINVAMTHRHEAAAMMADLSDHQLAHHLDTAIHLAGAELYLDCYPEAQAHADRAIAVGLATDRANLSRWPTRSSVRSSCSVDSWPRQPSCSTTPSMAHDCPATSKPSPETCSTGL